MCIKNKFQFILRFLHKLRKKNSYKSLNIYSRFKYIIGVMIICSKFDCSTLVCASLFWQNQLLDTKNEIARIGLTGFLSGFIFCVQTNNCATRECLTRHATAWHKSRSRAAVKNMCGSVVVNMCDSKNMCGSEVMHMCGRLG